VRSMVSNLDLSTFQRSHMLIMLSCFTSEIYKRIDINNKMF